MTRLGAPASSIGVIDLGRRRFGDVLTLQRDYCVARGAGTEPLDLLLLVEHEPVYTMGRSTKESSLPVSREQLQADGTDVFEVERGGEVTWHGPRQLVAYPILDLGGWTHDLHWYLRTLEATTIDALGSLGIAAEPSAGRTGVWTNGRKIASIGVHVKKWVTMHGLAINVTNDLSPFARVVPCGLAGVTMTSVANEIGAAPSGYSRLDADARSALVTAFGAQFDREMVTLDGDAAHALVAGTAGVS